MHLFPHNGHFALLPLLMGVYRNSHFYEPWQFRVRILYKLPCPLFDVPYYLICRTTTSQAVHTVHHPNTLFQPDPRQPSSSVTNVPLTTNNNPHPAPPMTLWLPTITNSWYSILGSSNYPLYLADLIQLGFYIGHTASELPVHLRTFSMDGHFRHT